MKSRIAVSILSALILSLVVVSLSSAEKPGKPAPTRAKARNRVPKWLQSQIRGARIKLQRSAHPRNLRREETIKKIAPAAVADKNSTYRAVSARLRSSFLWATGTLSKIIRWPKIGENPAHYARLKARRPANLAEFASRGQHPPSVPGPVVLARLGDRLERSVPVDYSQAP